MEHHYLEETNKLPKQARSILDKDISKRKLLPSFLRLGAGYGSAKVWNMLLDERWVLGYRLGNPSQVLTSKSYQLIIPPEDREWADPFIIEKNGKYYVFIEEVIFKNGKGHISVFELEQDGSHTIPKIIIEKDYHLSYPFLFQDKDTLYMIPETSKNKRIELYRCIQFPDK